MGPQLWLVVAIALALIEMLTPGIFFFACFAAGALASSLSALFGAPEWACWTVFFGVSFLLILFVAPIAKRLMKKSPSAPVGLDGIEGQTAWTIKAIEPSSGQGQVRLSNGAIWIATSEQPIPEGSQVEIIRIKGTRLFVRQMPEQTCQ